MTKRDFLLHQLIEECAEVQRSACNCLKYGENDANPSTKQAFYQEICNKINDLEAIIELLGIEKDPKKQQQKCCRIEYWANYCRERGRLTE